MTSWQGEDKGRLVCTYYTLGPTSTNAKCQTNTPPHLHTLCHPLHGNTSFFMGGGGVLPKHSSGREIAILSVRCPQFLSGAFLRNRMPYLDDIWWLGGARAESVLAAFWVRHMLIKAKKKSVCLPSHALCKVGSVGRSFFFFFLDLYYSIATLSSDPSVRHFDTRSIFTFLSP